MQDHQTTPVDARACGLRIHASLLMSIYTLGVASHANPRTSNQFFDVELWLQADFKNEQFWAYNDEHLNYLERYISATLRGHKERTHFTLLEKLPKFYHEAKNREALLKIIAKLKSKLG